MPNYALSPSQPLQTTIRSLRRSIGHPIHPTSVETFPACVTHVLLSRPTPCLALFAVLVDPSLALVDLNNETYSLSNDVLAPADVARWAGTVHLSARSFWCNSGPALRGLRISTLGALRPRGAGSAAPSTEIIRVLVTRAGATVTDESPDLVLVAPGISRRGEKARKLLDENVLCLGAGFVVDLLFRLHANPEEYLAFPEQRGLCGPILDMSLARTDRPLPLTQALFKRSTQSSIADPATEVTQKGTPKSKRVRTRRGECETTETHHPKSPSTPKHNEDSSNKLSFGDEDIEPTPEQKARKSSMTTTPSEILYQSNEEASARLTRKRCRNSRIRIPNSCRNDKMRSKSASVDASVAPTSIPRDVSETVTVLNPVTCNLISQAVDESLKKKFRSGDSKEDRLGSEAPIARKSTAGTEGKQTPTFGRQSMKTKLHREDLISPITPAAHVPKRPRLKKSLSKQLSPFQDKRCEDLSTLTSHSDADTVLQRQLRFPREDSKYRDCRALSPSSQSSSGSFISRKADRYSFSVNDGFHFLFVRLGEPLQGDVDKLLRCIKHRDDGDIEDTLEQRTQGNPDVGDIERRSHRPNPRAAESPVLVDEDVFFPNSIGTVQERQISDETRGVTFENDMPHPRLNVFGSKTPTRVVDAFRIPVPKRKVIISNIILPYAGTLDQARQIKIVDGHNFDDKSCQDGVDCLDWVLGADNIIGVSRDALQANPANSRSRKIWSSLFESNALQRFAAPGRLPDVEARVLTGLCVRLITSAACDNMKKILVTQLLSVRDNQIRAGFDSLQNVLMSGHLNDTSLHHKCIGAIWSSLLQSSIVNGDRTGAWELLNSSLISRVDAVLNSQKLEETKAQYNLEKELTKVLRDTVLTSYMFSTQLDLTLNIRDAANEDDPNELDLHPENWHMVYYCMDKLCEMGLSNSSLPAVFASSTSFLRNVAQNIAGTVWPITDKVVARTSQMIEHISSLNGKTCSCEASSTLFDHIWASESESNINQRCFSGLQTMCDSLFLMAWLFTVRGSGSPMKRAMTVTRIGSSLTRGKENYLGVRLHSINHHVGMLMSLADSLANSSKDGELLLCRMLTSKCRRPTVIVRRNSTDAGEQEACWRATLMAVQKRCKILLSRRHSVNIYIKWLTQNLLETLSMMRRSPRAASATLLEKEALRARDSVFCSLAILISTSLTDVNRSVLTSLQADHDLRERLKEDVLAEPVFQISSYMKISRDLISQMRSNPEESVSKNWYGLLKALFSLLNVQILLMRRFLTFSQYPGSSSENPMYNNEMIHSSALAFVAEDDLENVLTQTMSTGCPGVDLSKDHDMLKLAAGMLANLIELRNYRSNKKLLCGDHLTTVLQDANLDVITRFGTRSQLYIQLKPRVPLDAEDSYRHVFWSEAVRCTWIIGFLQRTQRSHVICTSAVLALLSSMTDDCDDQHRAATVRLIKDCAKLESLKYIFEPIRSNITSLDNKDDSLARVTLVEKALRILIKYWPIDEVRSLLTLLQHRLKDVVRLKASMQPDAVILYSFTHTLSAQIGGFNHARSLHSPLGDIAYAVSRMANSSRDYSITFRLVQMRVLSALCMATSDMETRVMVLRVVNAFPASNALPGFWETALLPTGEVPETWTKRAEKYAQEWRSFVFTSAIEDPLFAGRSVGCAVRRLAAASKGDEAVRRLVQGVLVRGRGKLDFMLRSDGRTWREWSALCEELLEA